MSRLFFNNVAGATSNARYNVSKTKTKKQADADVASMLDAFTAKSVSGKLTVGIMGMGYVGVPLAEAFVRAGTPVIGFEILQNRADDLNAGKSYLGHIEDERIQRMVDSGNFKATIDQKMLKEADAILICVPTPLDKYHHPDLSYVTSTCESITPHLRKGHLIVLESTTYPGTTQDIMRPILEKSGLIAGRDFALAYSPEREDPGNIDFETSTIPKLVGADSEDERGMSKLVYDRIVETVMVPNSRTAEAAKLTENIFRWVNIGLVNELKLVYDKMGIDVWDVIEAAGSKPFGFMPFYPGPGVGGHCIRIDPYYLTWKAREHGMSTRFIELAGEVNIHMPQHVVNRLMEELNKRHSKALSGSKILLSGIAYKKNIDDMRESPSMEVWHLLEEYGAEVEFYDPFIDTVPETHEFPQYAGRKSMAWDVEKLKTFDAAVVTTAHSFVDYSAMAENIPLVIDTRNISADLTEELKAKVAKA